jgi:UDPglucose 6-dehydrogenase/UDP-N-acetyl-D-galactosamine dehydrogenase
VTRSEEPDLSYVKSAAETVSENLKQGSVVILESMVYPGVTEEVVKPIPERSGLRCGRDFKVAYSPERLNPNFLRKNLVKPSDIPLRSSQIIVSGMDEETTGIVSKLYARITTVYAAKVIRTAEAAKVTPNLQRNFLRKNLVKPSDIPLRSSQIIVSGMDEGATAAPSVMSNG